jgi:Mn-dependent DtxR family transcriptional regulator
MSESDILGWLKAHRGYLAIARAVEVSPKTAREIAQIVNVAGGRCAEVLSRLETARAVEYAGAGWRLTEKGKQVLAKYFK